MSDERGSVTIIVAVMIVLLALLAAGLGSITTLLAAQGRAQVAADAAALAAAPITFGPFGSGLSPDQEAAAYARANGARLVACTGCSVDRAWRARTVEVEVAVDVDLPGIGLIAVAAWAAAQFAPAQLLGAP